MTNERRKSDRPVVPVKRSNKAGSSAAEIVEGRGLAKRNAAEQNRTRTQRRTILPSALDRVRQAARRNKDTKFTALFHHVTRENLRVSFMALRRAAAPGVDSSYLAASHSKCDENAVFENQKPSTISALPISAGSRRLAFTFWNGARCGSG